MVVSRDINIVFNEITPDRSESIMLERTRIITLNQKGTNRTVSYIEKYYIALA
jgi:hypothetical protein